MKKLFKLILTAILILAAIYAYSKYIEPNNLTVKTLNISTQKDIKDFKAVFFTDTHFGELYSVDNAQKISDKINSLNPDIVIFGGDLLDNYARDKENIDFDKLSSALSSITAKNGKFAVFGNHDIGGGAVRMYDDFMSSCGFTVLCDESVYIDEYNIKIVGFDDIMMSYTEQELYTLKSDYFNIIAAHEPETAKYIQSHSDNFMLTGHTHGGQVYIPFLTDKILPPGSGGFRKGLYTQEEINTNTSINLYVSSGIGLTKVPFRLFNTPEIIEINFKKENWFFILALYLTKRLF